MRINPKSDKVDKLPTIESPCMPPPQDIRVGGEETASPP